MSKILAIFRTPDMSTAQYDSVIKDLESAGKGTVKARPYHFMAVQGAGSTVVDMWDSTDDLNEFFGTLGPILVKNGITPPQPEIMPIHGLIV